MIGLDRRCTTTGNQIWIGVLVGMFCLGLLMMGLSLLMKWQRLNTATCIKCSRTMAKLSFGEASGDKSFAPYFSSNVSFLKGLSFFKCEVCEHRCVK